MQESPLSIAATEDPVFAYINQELARQQSQVELIASENIVSLAVLRAQGSILTNKYAEGYPGKRYYGGCVHVDEVEKLAIERAKQLFQCGYANVQPHSGSQANQAVFFSLLKPGDCILGMSLAGGGHLTHGSSVNLSGKWFSSASYTVTEEGVIDYNAVARIALEFRPKLLIAGGSAYGRLIDFSKMRKIADSVNAYFMVDMAHFAGLVAGGVYPNPFPHAHVVTSTTHKTLRGPRGGLVLTQDAVLAKKIDSAVFPGLQGGPLMHVIAAKAVAFGEALLPDFRNYAAQIVQNAKALGEGLQKRGYPIVSGGTDSHLMLVDLSKAKGAHKITGVLAESTLERAGLTCNKNTIPNDPLGPMVTSGIRLGTPAVTTRGFQESEMVQVGNLVADVLDALQTYGESPENQQACDKVIAATRESVAALCQRFPIYAKCS